MLGELGDEGCFSCAPIAPPAGVEQHEGGCWGGRWVKHQLCGYTQGKGKGLSVKAFPTITEVGNLVFKGKINFLCKLFVLSAESNEVILITQRDVSTSVPRTKSKDLSKKADGASYISLFCPCSPLLHFPTSSQKLQYCHTASPGSRDF